MSRTIRSISVAYILAASLALHVAPAQALFEDLAVSPRARAMGEATSATANDAWAFYYNPAMLTRLANPQLGLATVQPNGLDFNRLTTLAAAVPLPKNRGAIAIGWRHYGVEYGDVQLSTENTLTVAHGFQLFGDASTSASVGWAVSLYNAQFARSVGAAGDGSNGIDPGNAWAAGIDIGGLVTVYDRTRVGFFTHNLNSPVIGDDSEELQRSVTAGIAYEPYAGVTTAFDIRSTLGETFRFCGGVECNIVPAFDLRVGIETEPNKVTAGFGVHLPVVTLDYGFSSGGGVLDTSHHFGVELRWDRGAVEASQ